MPVATSPWDTHSSTEPEKTGQLDYRCRYCQEEMAEIHATWQSQTCNFSSQTTTSTTYVNVLNAPRTPMDFVHSNSPNQSLIHNSIHLLQDPNPQFINIQFKPNKPSYTVSHASTHIHTQAYKTPTPVIVHRSVWQLLDTYITNGQYYNQWRFCVNIGKIFSQK